MGNVTRHSIFIIIDNDKEDAKKCFNILKPFLWEQGIEIATERFESSANAGCERLESEKGCDIVLLDIKGVDEDGTAVERLHAINPYVPIVMISNQFEADYVLDYLAHGARTFISKKHLVPGIQSDQSGLLFIQRQNEDRNLRLRTIAHRLRRIVDEYQPIKNLLNRDFENGDAVKKREDNTDDVRNRIEYLKLLKASPLHGSVFPRVIDVVYNFDEIVYRIPYYDLKTLRSVVLDGTEQDACEQIVHEAVRKVLEFMISNIYLDMKDRDYDRSRIKDVVTGRILTRLDEARQWEPPAEGGFPIHRWEILKVLLAGTDFESERGRSFKHPYAIIRELGEDSAFIERMAPPWLSRIHGDLHFSNIMIDDRLPKAVRFRLIDPKGTMVWRRLGINDPAYDFGKMFQSTSGHYDLIDVGYLRPDFDHAGFPQLVPEEWVEYELQGGRSKAKITMRRQQYRPWTKLVFERTASCIEEVVRKQTEYVAGDPDWLIRARFYEAAHMLSATPIHLPNVSLATAVFVRGVELLNGFYTGYRGGRFPRPR